ncbi:MAG: polymer-forming cytoskeletal protein [Deltaproteobacteria bacterium]|nr:polymer-forming cytoskeletal protein [Deltaproteobacteria bacterium]
MAFWKKNEEVLNVPGAKPAPAAGTTAAKAATPGKAASPEKAATPPKPPSNFADNVVAPVAAIRPSLDRDTTVTGKLSFNAPTRIDGKLHGEVRANDLLIIGEEAFVEGLVQAAKLVILGEVRGDVQVQERVEIGITGRVTGAIKTRNLVVLEGGTVNADCRVTGA